MRPLWTCKPWRALAFGATGVMGSSSLSYSWRDKRGPSPRHVVKPPSLPVVKPLAAHCEQPGPPTPRALYPELEPERTGMLSTADGKHQIYYEVSGNPSGKPAVFLHGGPGGGSAPKHRRLFDPAVFRIVVLDQRGSGKSLPSGSTEQNTTQLLVQDLELLRHHLGIDSWSLVVGGSWGSALALAYSQAHPSVVHGMVLYAIFLPSRRSIDWTYSPGGAGEFFPDAYHAFLNHLPKDERATPLQSYHARLRSSDDAVRLPAKAALSRWTLTCLALRTDDKFIESVVSRREDLGDGSLIETHYMLEGCFLEDGQLLDACDKIAHIPCSILHGRYDMICPPGDAWRLHQALPLSQIQIVPESGHSSSAAPLLLSAIIEAIDRFR